MVVRQHLGLRSWSARRPRVGGVVVPNSDLLGDWTSPLPPDDLLALDQTDPAERAWVTRCLSEEPLPDGSVVELGTWLGAMSLTIGAAMRDGSRSSRRFHAYDSFRLDGHEEELNEAVSGTRYCAGDSFRALYDKRIAAVADHVDVHEGLVEHAEWPRESPIAFIFNDVAKSWSTWLAVRSTFYSALQPGSIVVEQDFAHPYTPWLHLSHHRWRSYFEVVGAIPGTQSVVMRLVHPLGRDELTRNDLVEGFTPREIQDAFDWAESLVEPKSRSAVAAARVMLYVLHGEVSVAAAELMKSVSDSALSREHTDELFHLVAERLVEGEVVTRSTEAIDHEVNTFISAMISMETDRLDDREPAGEGLVEIARRTHRARCEATDWHPLSSWREARAVRESARSSRKSSELWRAR